MSEDKYSLYYFGIPGRAASIRLLFHVAGVDYNNVVLDKEKFVELKTNGFLPFGKVPALQKGDFVLAETIPIGEYLAKEFGLWPKDEKDSAVASSILSAMGDYGVQFHQLHSAKPEEKEEKLKEVLEKFRQFENGVAKILGDKEYFFDDKLTLVDISLFGFFHGLVKVENLKQENLKKFHQTVLGNKKIVEYFQQQSK
eukprot:gene12779-7053_t